MLQSLSGWPWTPHDIWWVQYVQDVHRVVISLQCLDNCCSHWCCMCCFFWTARYKQIWPNSHYIRDTKFSGQRNKKRQPECLTAQFEMLDVGSDLELWRIHVFVVLCCEELLVPQTSYSYYSCLISSDKNNLLYSLLFFFFFSPPSQSLTLHWYANLGFVVVLHLLSALKVTLCSSSLSDV